jgi:hypothetical protein
VQEQVANGALAAYLWITAAITEHRYAQRGAWTVVRQTRR